MSLGSFFFQSKSLMHRADEETTALDSKASPAISDFLFLLSSAYQDMIDREPLDISKSAL